MKTGRSRTPGPGAEDWELNWEPEQVFNPENKIPRTKDVHDRASRVPCGEDPVYSQGLTQPQSRPDYSCRRERTGYQTRTTASRVPPDSSPDERRETENQDYSCKERDRLIDQDYRPPESPASRQTVQKPCEEKRPVIDQDYSLRAL
ncbi:hypothetical protein WMY93_033947 [Mugilogobius chulae]|uniref:Uncharacterized protein n=1 Tax=Mugilogobius chulae TaxID=88201 RepID=A0AAW0MIL7_9GOBI